MIPVKLLIATFITLFVFIEALSYRDLSYEEIVNASFALQSRFARVESAVDMYGVNAAKEVSICSILYTQ